MPDQNEAGENKLYVYNGGFLTQPRIRRILELSGWKMSIGKPVEGDFVGVWGQSPTSGRGEWIGDLTNAQIIRVEDSFLRSVLPGRSGSDPTGLNIDRKGVHFDPAQPSDLETLLATHPLDDTALLNRARDAAEKIKRLNLSKYNAFPEGAATPEAPYVLVIDQTRDDASVTASGANENTFREMLVFAQTEHPGSRIIIKSHPETQAGHRDGHFSSDMANERISFCDWPVSPWSLMEGALGVYTVSSQLGFEAIYAGHKPRVFGQPFYAGWGLTQDEFPVPRRNRNLTRAQLFAAAMILYPTWYDPCRDRICELEDVIDLLAADARSWREDQAGWSMAGMSKWKEPHLINMFGRWEKPQFENSVKKDRPKVVWGNKEPADRTSARMEDGFIRSRGLGAKLVPPVSLIIDREGMYYDPTRPSELEKLIFASTSLPDTELARARKLVNRLKKLGITKYNIGGNEADILGSEGKRKILVPGQVEDDISVVLGCLGENTNEQVLERTRRENPDAFITYKPHPDVEAGLRPGALSSELADAYADYVAENTSIVALLDWADEVWTLSSLAGFEALIRGKSVTCLGRPFYAGWGLTKDLNGAPDRRKAQPNISQLVHACLIDYPRYHDPVSNLPCPVEVIIDRLESGELIAPPSKASKLQSFFSWSMPLIRRLKR